MVPHQKTVMVTRLRPVVYFVGQICAVYENVVLLYIGASLYSPVVRTGLLTRVATTIVPSLTQFMQASSGPNISTTSSHPSLLRTRGAIINRVIMQHYFRCQAVWVTWISRADFCTYILLLRGWGDCRQENVTRFYYDNIPSAKVCVNALFFFQTELTCKFILPLFSTFVSKRNLFPTTTTSRHLHTIQCSNVPKMSSVCSVVDV